MRYCMRAFLAALFCALFVSGDAAAFDSYAFSEVDAVISKRTDISAAKKKGLVEAARRVFAEHEDLGADKHANIRDHTTLYLNSLIESSSPLTDGQFQVRIMTFEWRLGNYCRLTPINDADRARGKAVLKNIPEGVRKAVYETFADTPDDIKDRLIDEALKMFSKQKEMLGNYYVDGYLYPSENVLSADEVALAIKKHPRHQNNANAFASVAEILSNPDFPERTKEGHVEMFLFRESAKFHMPLWQLMAEAFHSQIEPGQYQNPPPELREAQQKLYEELFEQSKKQSKRMMEEALKPPDYKYIADEALADLDFLTEDVFTVEPAQAPKPGEVAPEKDVAQTAHSATVEPETGRFLAVALMAAGVLVVAVVLAAVVWIRRGRKS